MLGWVAGLTDAGATLRGAVLATAGAIVAAAIGLGSAWIAGNYQESESTKESRRDVYVAFLADAGHANELLANLTVTVTAEQAAQVVADFDKMGEDISRLMILGSRDASSAAQEVVVAMYPFRDFMAYTY